MEIIKPKEPKNKKYWQLLRVDQHELGPVHMWLKSNGVVVGSAVEAPEPNTIGPEYHVSISKNGGRISADEATIICREFGMEGPDEDNHVNGIARHFWEPVRTDMKGYVCPCKRTEPAIVQGDFIYRPLENS